MVSKNRFVHNSFTLLEIMMIMAIMGLLAAMVVPNFVFQLDIAKITTTKTNLEILRRLLDEYYVYEGEYPTSDDLNELYSGSSPSGKIYISRIPPDGFKKSSSVKIPPLNNTGGWVYFPTGGMIKPNLFGTDPEGMDFCDY